MKPGVDYIGVACIFYCHDGKGNFLLHKRSKNCKDEQLTWDCGGGAMEFGESMEEAVRREVMEEYCVEIKKLQFVKADNVLRKNGDQKTHWLALVFACLVDPKRVKNGEPTKIDEVGWFTPDKFPHPQHSKLMSHFQFLVEAGLV